MSLTEIDGISSLNNKLNETTTQHEESLVVDRSYDRVVKWVGVYLIFVLAVLFQIMEFACKCKVYVQNYLNSVIRSSSENFSEKEA